MAQNSIYPGYVRIKYTVAGRPHHQILPVIPAAVYEPGYDDPFFLLGDGISEISFASAMDSYDDILDDGLNTGDGQIQLAEFFQLATPTSDPVFIYAIDIGHAGASISSTVAFSQRTTSFRTSMGGYYKNVVLDQTSPVNQEDPYPFGAGAAANLAAYLMNPATNWIRGRDGGRIISGINSITKTNDALRRKYLLNS